MYFPSIDSDHETISPDELNWDSIGIGNLCDFLELNNTRFYSFKDGSNRIRELLGQYFKYSSFDRNSNWYWASAGKTLTALMVGIAQEDGLLSLRTVCYIYW